MACRTAPMDSTCLPEMPRRAFLAIVAGGFLAAPLVAEGQPAGKVWRIGAVVGSDVNYAAFLQGCVRQVGSRGGTRRSSVVLSRASRRGFPPWLRRLSRSRSTSPSPPPASNPKLPEGNERHSHRGARSRKRSSGERVRGEPRATRGKPHRRLPGSAGGQWQTASVAQGNAARSGAGGRAVGTEVGEPQLRATEEAARVAGVTLNVLGIRRAEEVKQPATDRSAGAEVSVADHQPLHKFSKRGRADGLWSQST